jgi:hypothetical protein
MPLSANNDALFLWQKNIQENPEKSVKIFGIFEDFL